MTVVQERLFALQDLKYRDFQAKLMPTVNKDTIIGVRTPELRKLAKELKGGEEAAEFLRTLPHEYYDENNLHGFLLCEIKDYSECVAALDAFLPQVDNWATCDLMSPKCFRRHKAELKADIRRWLASDELYTVRFGIEMLMSHFLDGDFFPESLDWVASIRSEEYYLRMMQAWYFATALAKQYDAALPYIEEHRLDDWTHNKAIQKSVESYRISDKQKEYLRSLKIKKR